MATKEKAIAVGTLIITMLDLSKKHGGKQKVQKIVGKKIFYESNFRGKWMVNNPEIARLSVSQLNRLTEKLKKAL
jgi:hypothetical protein